MPNNREIKGRSACAFRKKELIGRITRTELGSTFEYDDAFLKTIKNQEEESGAAYRLPYRRKKTETLGVNLHPFFAGLLPEGLRLKALVKTVKTSEDDLLSLLMAVGTDCIGDISVTPEGGQAKAVHESFDLQDLSNMLFDELLKKSISPTGILEETNIPGIQEKVSASRISLPLKRTRRHSSYILKLMSADKPRIVENEFFFLKMAKACGLIVSEAKIVQDKSGVSGLLVTRFDRTSDGDFLHQEDACQFLDRYPADKYRISFSEIAAAMTELCSTPLLEIGKLIRLKAFSYLIANGDLHAKNISVFTSKLTTRIEMTPAYDLLSTLPYGDQKMALKLDGKDDRLKRKNFVEFGKRFDVKEPAVHAILDEICDVSNEWVNRLEEIGLTDQKTNQLCAVMLKRRKDLC